MNVDRIVVPSLGDQNHSVVLMIASVICALYGWSMKRTTMTFAIKPAGSFKIRPLTAVSTQSEKTELNARNGPCSKTNASDPTIRK